MVPFARLNSTASAFACFWEETRDSLRVLLVESTHVECSSPHSPSTPDLGVSGVESGEVE